MFYGKIADMTRILPRSIKPKASAAHLFKGGRKGKEQGMF
jgi:hypothetical protein